MRLSINKSMEKAVAVLVASKTAPENARSVAHALVMAEADGLGGHGLMRLPFYAAQAQCGKIDGLAHPEVTQRMANAIAIDAANGFAYPEIDLAVEELIAATFKQGVAAASVARSSHCGAMDLVVEKLATHGLSALMFANTPGAMAVWGGKRALLGTNPIACAFARPSAPLGGAKGAALALLWKFSRPGSRAAILRLRRVPFWIHRGSRPARGR